MDMIAVFIVIVILPMCWVGYRFLTRHERQAKRIAMGKDPDPFFTFVSSIVVVGAYVTAVVGIGLASLYSIRWFIRWLIFG
jgi:hypothetical protein